MKAVRAPTPDTGTMHFLSQAYVGHRPSDEAIRVAIGFRPSASACQTHPGVHAISPSIPPED